MLFMGRLSPIKNLVRLVEAWATVGSAADDWMLVLAGAAEFGYDKVLGTEIERFGLSGQVHWVGPVYGQDKRDGFDAAECFVLPSLSEGFGMVVLEAIAAGLPALTTSGASWECLRREGCGWWVKPDVGGLADALREIFGHDTRTLQDMGDRARALAKRDFTWRTVCEQTGRLYDWLRHGGSMPSFVACD